MPPAGDTPDLETRLQRAERDAAEARLEADAANTRLQAFMHGVSHDLRAPLRAIDGFAARLAPKMAADADARDAVARIRAATTRMGGLIDGMVEMARVGSVELRPTHVDVSLLADWALAELQDADTGRAVEATIQPGLEVVGDERLLKTLLDQLLANAWRFSASRDKVTVAVEATDEMMPGVVSLPHGWGHHRRGTQLQVAQAHAGVSVNDLTDDRYLDDLSGNVALNGVPVQIVPAG